MELDIRYTGVSSETEETIIESLEELRV